MAYFSLGAYDADIYLNAFAGLQQYGDGMNGDVRYAVEEQNMETPAGVLQPQAAPVMLDYSFTAKIETLAHLYRRWYTGSGSPEVLFAATGGKIFYKSSTDSAFVQLAFPAGVSSYASNVWSWAAYEINPAGSSSPVDVLLMSNAKDGMIMVVPPYTATVSNPNWKAEKITTPKKFGVIERYAERIWGGAIEGDPDTLVYSRPFDPTNWTAAGPTEEPEDGAGDIMQPSWDGDSFTALRQFGQQLIAFKKHRVWRILGTDPGEYTFKEQYGGGAPYYNTIAVDTERILMAEKDGLAVYDGLSVNPVQRETIEKVWRSVNKDHLDQMCGVLFKQKYYLAFPVGTSTYNNAMLIWNLQDGTILYYSDISVESFLATEDTLYATSATAPGKIMVVNWDSWVTGSASGAATKWVSPWMTLGNLDIQKGGFDLYFTPEVQSAAVTLVFSIQTEKKIKTKKYTVQPLTAMDIANHKNYRQKRLHFGGTGRRFRLIIETASGTTAPWRLIGGLKIIAETDPD